MVEEENVLHHVKREENCPGGKCPGKYVQGKRLDHHPRAQRWMWNDVGSLLVCWRKWCYAADFYAVTTPKLSCNLLQLYIGNKGRRW